MVMQTGALFHAFAAKSLVLCLQKSIYLWVNLNRQGFTWCLTYLAKDFYPL